MPDGQEMEFPSAAVRAAEAELDEGTAAEVWGRGHTTAAPNAGQADPPDPDGERGLTWRELIMLVTEELRYASPEALDGPVRVELGDTTDGIQSLMYDPDTERLVLRPWLTRRVERLVLPQLGFSDFAIANASYVPAALRVLRKRREMDRASASARAQCSLSTLSNAENGMDPPSPALFLRLLACYQANLHVRDDGVDRFAAAELMPDFNISHESQFALVMRALRVRRGMTVEALALKAGVSKRSLDTYEAGTRVPRLPTLTTIYAALEAEMVVTDPRRRIPGEATDG